MEVIFVAGIHGVGKGTLCQELKDKLEAHVYSCSDLIKKHSDYVENGKAVTNAERNQLALIKGLEELDGERVLLDGHFCLLGKNADIIELEFNTFEAINPDKIILVTCDKQIIAKRLMVRDGKSIDINLLKSLQESEVSRSKLFCTNGGIPIFEFVSGKSDTDELCEWLSE